MRVFVSTVSEIKVYIYIYYIYNVKVGPKCSRYSKEPNGIYNGND